MLRPCCLVLYFGGLMTAASLGPPSALAQVKLADRIIPLVKAHEGKVAVAVKHLERDETFSHNADQPMPTASLIKFPVMVEAYAQAEAGKLGLEKRVTLRAEDKVPGSGILTAHFSPGASLTVQDCIRLMIAFSDNTATNLVLDQIGLPATNEHMEKLELPHTKIHAQVFRAKTSIHPDRSKQFGLGSTTAGEMIRLLQLVHEKKLVSPAACDAMLAHLRECDDKNRIRRFLPASVKVAHKTGSVTAVRTAAGIIEAPSGPIAICVLTSENKDQRWTTENAAEKLIADISREVYQHFQPANAAEKVAESKTAEEILRLGSQGELVSALQRTLNARLKSAPELTVDGEFGAATKEAVMAFQRGAELVVSGEVGQDTWKALGPLVWNDPPAPDPAVINAQQLTRQPPDSLDGPPHVTCKAWAIADGATGELLWSEKASDKLDFASTTKIMTAWIVVQLATADPKVLSEEVLFSEMADKTGGTTSSVKAGERLSVGELLYGLLLPSGNDAAVALAEHFGARLAKEKATDSQASFVAEMNRQAEQLNMQDTNYVNPHGLSARGHVSSARDQIKLAFAALQNPLFSQYVNTRQHGASVVGPGGYQRNIVWKNTNQLLDIEGYSGVKTGTTNAAGACLVSAGERGGQRLLVVVLGSSSSPSRYADSRNLYRWAWQQRLKK